MAHAATRRRRNAGDESYDRLLDVLLYELCRLLLCRSTDLADHQNRIGLRIVIEQSDSVDEARPVDGIAADADARRLAEADIGKLAHCLVGECTRARDEPDAAALVNEARHDADLAFVWRDDARAVRTDQARRSGS